jgi:RNA polymerase sigma-70 factor, ECF subfamily
MWFGQLATDPIESALASVPERAAAQALASNPEQPILGFYGRFRDPIYRYLLCLRLSPEVAEDIVQEAFLRLHASFKKEKIRVETVPAWLFRVAHNLAVSTHRRESEVAMSSAALVALADARSVDPQDGPEDTVLQKEWLRRVGSVVQSLPEQHQRCLHLRAEGLRYREISDVLGIPVSTVAHHLRRAIESLMEALDE